EPVLLVESLYELGVLPRLLPPEVVEGSARRQLDDDEADEGDPDEERDRQHQPAQSEQGHLARGIALQRLRYAPGDEGVGNARRLRLESAHAGRDGGERIIEIEEDERLILGEDLLDAMVDGDALLLGARGPPLLQEGVDLGVRVGDLIELI